MSSKKIWEDFKYVYIEIFFDIKNRDENKKLFDGLYISNSLMMSEQGKYPVIFITMKGISTSNFKEAFERIADKVSTLYRNYTFLIEKLDRYEKEKFSSIVSENCNSIQY